MGSKLEISPYLFNHQYDPTNPKILARPYSQSVEAVQLRSVMKVGTHKVHSTEHFFFIHVAIIIVFIPFDENTYIKVT